MPNLSAGGTVTAMIEAPDTGGDGILWEIGDWNSGAAVVIVDGTVRAFLSNASEVSRASAVDPLTSGHHDVSVEFRPEPNGAATMLLVVDGTEVASARCAYGVPHLWQHGGTALTIGFGRGFPVDDSYHHPFAFSGTVHQVTFEAGALPERQFADIAEQAIRLD
jgi:hypothetical protein